MTGAGGDTGRGVRAAARGLRTWRKLVGMVLAAALIGAASAAAWKASRTTTPQWYAVGMLMLSETLIDAGLNPRRPKEIRHPDGRTETVTLGAIANHPPLLALRERMIDDLLAAALIGLGIGAGIAVAALAGLHYAGGRLKRGRRLRGGELVSARQLRHRVAPLRLRLRRRFGHGSDRPCRIFPFKFPGGWPVARIRLRYAKRPKVAERFAPRAEGETGAGRVEMPEDGWAERPDEANEAIEQAPEAEAEVDLWESEPLAEDTEIVRTDPNAERLEAADEPQGASQPEPAFPEETGASEGVETMAVREAARTDVDPDSGPGDNGRPPGAIGNQPKAKNGAVGGAKPEGRMIRI